MGVSAYYRACEAARVLYTTAATDTRMAAMPDVWDAQQFHAVRIKVRFLRGKEMDVDAIADTGAGPSLVSEDKLSVEVTDSIKPGKAQLMHSASSHHIKSKGAAGLEFTLGNSDQVFRHQWQITEGTGMPTILGNNFW